MHYVKESSHKDRCVCVLVSERERDCSSPTHTHTGLGGKLVVLKSQR